MREGKSEARREVTAELHRVAERLRAMVAAYEENPRAFDDDTLIAAGCATAAEELITEIYRVMRAQVYTQDSPLREDEDEWTAFKEHQEEFRFFHKRALNAVECYQEVLHTYTLLKEAFRRCPEPGSSARIREDKNIQLAERENCIEAIANFERKLSAMLTVFRSGEASGGSVIVMH